MKRIESFCVDHTKLKKGLYVSRKDSSGGTFTTTFDLRFVSPNVEPVMETAGIHTIEHLGATFLRNSEYKDKIIYFGPMGCRTGFYLVMFGDLESTSILPLVKSTCKFIIDFQGEIPGASPAECGNYKDQNLEKAKEYTRKYLSELETFNRLNYEK